MKTATEILAITEPEFLFTGSPLALDDEYKKLRKLYHPDINHDPLATEVFAHLTELHSRAVEKLKAGIWNKPNYLQLTDLKTAKVYEIHYYKKYSIDIGVMYISKGMVTFIIDNQYKDLYQNALRMMTWKYASSKMEEQLSRCLPKVKMAFETMGHCVLIVEKDPGLVLLKDILEYYKQEIDHRHTAWVLSTAYNLACYMQYAGISNNNIGLDTYFINPEKHGGTLLGGWWFAAKRDEKLKALPVNAYNICPSDVISEKKFNPRIDLELIRGMGRELVCGSMNKVHLVRNHKTCPAALKSWLTGASVGDARQEYEFWQGVLTASFGPRKFTPMEVRAEEIYK